MSDEVVQIVRLIGEYNRHRFAAERDLLAAWTAASNIIGPAHAGEKTTGEIKPAA